MIIDIDLVDNCSHDLTSENLIIPIIYTILNMDNCIHIITDIFKIFLATISINNIRQTSYSTYKYYFKLLRLYTLSPSNLSSEINNLEIPMNLLSKSSFNISITKERWFDITVKLIPIEILEVFDIVLSLNTPIQQFYDILVTPFVNIPVNNFNMIRKGDNPFDFMMTDTNEDGNMVMKALGRDFGYYKDKSLEYNKILGFVDEYKPLTQDLVKTKIDNKFYVIKCKNSKTINLNKDWYEGVFIAKYEKTGREKSKNHIELLSYYNVGNIKRYGISKKAQIPTKLEPSCSNIISFWMLIVESGNWLFKLEGDNSTQLLIDDKIILEYYNTSTYGTTLYAECKMSAGFYKVIIRHENFTRDGGCTLSYFSPSSIDWRLVSNDNLGDKGKIYAYIPTEYDIYNNIIFKGLNKTPLNDMAPVQNVDYIFVNYMYYTDFYSVLKNNLINVNDAGVCIYDSQDDYYTAITIKDSESVNPVGWANTNVKNNGDTYIGYRFSNPISKFIKIEWYEDTDFGIKNTTLFKNFSDSECQSMIVKIKLMYADGTSSFLNTTLIDFDRCVNISLNSFDDNIIKNNSKGLSSIYLKNYISTEISEITIHRWDNIKKFWGLVTELNVYTIDDDTLFDDLFFVDVNNMDTLITEVPPLTVKPYGFYSIPLDNSVEIHKADIESVSKSNIITLYKENSISKIKYNKIML